MRGPRSRLIAVLAVLVLYAFHDELVKPMPAGIRSRGHRMVKGL